MDKPSSMTCLYTERRYQLYNVNGIPTVWHNWVTRKKQKDGTWIATPHEEIMKLADWSPELKAFDIRARMVVALEELRALA